VRLSAPLQRAKGEQIQEADPGAALMNPRDLHEARQP
jgi:hypothetical protein